MAVDFETVNDKAYEYQPDYNKTAFTYRIFVLAEDTRIKLLEVSGDDGNGYYGTGYWIEVLR